MAASESTAEIRATGPTRTPRLARLRATIAGHPVVSALVIMFGVGYPLMIPAALAGLPIEPFLLATVLFGQLGGALVVTAAADGRAGVRDLWARVFRWRVGVGGYLLAFALIPVATLVVASAVTGTAVIESLLDDPSVVWAYLAALSILPLVNLWEETAWMGVIQDRLARARTPLMAAAIVAPFFALIHLPLHLGEPPSEIAVSMALLVALGVALRVVAGWLYERTDRSILLVAGLHATFNAANNTGIPASSSGSQEALSTIPWIVVGVWAVLIVAAVPRWRSVRR